MRDVGLQRYIFSSTLKKKGIADETGNDAMPWMGKRRESHSANTEMLTLVDVLQALRASTVTRVIGSSASMPAGASPRVLTTVSEDASEEQLLCPPYVFTPLHQTPRSIQTSRTANKSSYPPVRRSGLELGR